MIDRKSAAEWLDRYVAAWKSYDPNAIGALFAADVRYYYTPYADPRDRARGGGQVVAG